MASDKELIQKLLKIANNQQKILVKLAQGLAETVETKVPPTSLEPAEPTKTEARAILNALPPPVRAAVEQLEVHTSRDPSYDQEVKVRFMAGKSSPAVFAALQKTVKDLQSKNVLFGQNYKITEVA